MPTIPAPRCTTFTTALVLWACACTGSAHANLLANGSFEDADVADGTFVSNAATGWTGAHFVMDPNVAGGLASTGGAWPQALAGQQYTDIGNTPAYGIAQTFTVASAGSYALTWLDHTGLGYASPWTALYTVSLSRSSSITVGSNLDARQNSGNWGQRAFVVNLAAGAYTLAFQPQGSTSLDVLIDNVAVTAVPEPGTWVLMLAGLGAVGWVARRRRA